MNHVDPHLREEARQAARAERLEMYADWLAHDVDGLIYQIPQAGNLSTVILADARELVSRALACLDSAIARDKQVHQESTQ